MKSIQEQYPDFVQEVDVLTIDQLKARIVQLQQALEESEDHKEQNEALNQARNEVKELLGPYSDVKKAVKAKTKYILELLRERQG